MFDEFVTQPEDDVNQRNEVAEALEDRGREHENENENEDDGVLDEFVNDPFRK